MTEVLTRYHSQAARRVAAFANHADYGFIIMLAALITLWTIGGKLLIG
jgi:hypothetical protein